MQNKIIIYGGTFDPIHHGHLEAANIALKAIGADKLYFVPVAATATKTRRLSAIKHRLAMLRIAIQNEPRFLISHYDLKHQNHYSINLVNAFQQRFRKATLYLLIGADQANQLSRWHEAVALTKMINIIYVKRPGSGVVTDVLGAKCKCVGAVTCDASATAIRKQPQLAWQPRAIIDYINYNALYGNERIQARLSDYRWKHCMRTARFARQLAISNHYADPQQAYVAGLYHDLAKEFSADQLIAAASALGIKKYTALGTLHAFVAYKIMRDEYLWTDEVVLNAVYRHTEPPTTQLTVLDKIIYVADKCEPARRKQDVSELYNVAKTAALAHRDINAAFTLIKTRIDAFWAQKNKKQTG